MKENNWKTEEALARASLTLETERIKGSNPDVYDDDDDDDDDLLTFRVRMPS